MSRDQYENFDAGEFVHELYSGVFAEQLATFLKETARNVDDHGRQGKVNVTLNFKPFIDGDGVMIEHTLTRDMPEKNGNSVRKITNKTHMYVGRNGAVSTLHEKQNDMFEDMADTSLSDGKVSPIKKGKENV